MKVLFLLLLLTSCGVKEQAIEAPEPYIHIVEAEPDTVMFLTTTFFVGFSHEYDEEHCSFDECVERARSLRDLTEVKYSICLQNVPIENAKLSYRKECQ